MPRFHSCLSLTGSKDGAAPGINALRWSGRAIYNALARLPGNLSAGELFARKPCPLTEATAFGYLAAAVPRPCFRVHFAAPHLRGGLSAKRPPSLTPQSAATSPGHRISIALVYDEYSTDVRKMQAYKWPAENGQGGFAVRGLFGGIVSRFGGRVRADDMYRVIT